MVRRPLDTKYCIIPPDAGLTFRHVDLRHLVRDFAVVLESLEAMGEAFPNVEQHAILSRENHGTMLHEGRGFWSEINDYIKIDPIVHRTSFAR